MPRLLLLRHAKSAWPQGVADIERPLLPRGQHAAERMGRAMAERGLLPDRILCSPALRTRETLAAILPHLTEENEIKIAAELYEPSGGDYREVVRGHGANADALLVIGHNPAIHATALALIGSGEATLTKTLAEKYPTAALAVIEFARGPWSKLAPRSGRLAVFLRPRDLPNGDSEPED